MTSNRVTDQIKRLMNVKEGKQNSSILQLRHQQNYWLSDGFPETFGLTPKKDESTLQFIWRVLNDRSIRDSNCLALQENMPSQMQHMNKFIETYDCTYYFALSTGDRKKVIEK